MIPARAWPAAFAPPGSACPVLLPSVNWKPSPIAPQGPLASGVDIEVVSSHAATRKRAHRQSERDMARTLHSGARRCSQISDERDGISGELWLCAPRDPRAWWRHAPCERAEEILPGASDAAFLDALLRRSLLGWPLRRWR